MATRFRSCPQCGSNQVQSVESAHVQSIRHGRDFSTISELGARLARPEPASAFFLPVAVGAALYTLILFGACLLSDTPITLAPRNLVERGQTAYLAAALLISLGVSVGMSAWAHQFNQCEFPKLIHAWETDRVCRSCLHRFPGPMAGGHQ